MKISTWNLNGIRAAYKKGLLDWMNEDRSEIYCFQEIKAKKDQIPEELLSLDGYQSYINSAQRPGYSGVALFSNIPPDEVEFGIGEERFDREGRVIRARFKDFHLFNVYFPNGQRSKDRVGFKLGFYAVLLEKCKTLMKQGEQVIITGDFNTAHNEIDLKNPKSNMNNSGFLPEERIWIDHYLASGFTDIYRELYPEEVKYSWWSYRNSARERNIGWRLDYFLITDRIKSFSKDVITQTSITGSDHCPVSLILK